MGKRRRLVALGAAFAALGTAAPVAAQQRLITIDTPSRYVDPSRVRFNGDDHPGRLRANVLLPDGYDGRRRFPVLFLLHGVGDDFAAWSEPERGDIRHTARGLSAVVVMPEAARGFYTSWWNDGRRGDPGWERFYLDELVPQVERELRVLPGRRNHAVAGLSMGGFGAAWLATQLPGYFGSAATFSGFVQHQRPEVEAGLRTVGEVEYTDIFGPMDAFYATGHNPTRLVGNLTRSRLYVTVGDGIPEPGVQSEPGAVLGGVPIEAELRQQSDELVAAARGAGVPITYRPLAGVHDWPYWRRHLRDAINWGLFRPVPESPTSWTYKTVARTGEAWGLRYEFAQAPERVQTLSRAGDRLRGSGQGTVALHNAAGCGWEAVLPFEKAVPPAICGRIRVRVRPRRIPLGRATRVRFRVKRVVEGRRTPVRGARVRLGARVTRTGRRGRAVVRYRPRGRPGRRRARVSVRGLRTVRPVIRAVRP
jgi:S-formylglutathione hydrolase FrmB